MHTRETDLQINHEENTPPPFWRKVPRAIPILGAFFNPMNKTLAQSSDKALSDSVSLASQVACMYVFPVKLTPDFPVLNHDMQIQMNIHMGTEMALRMWIGDVIGRSTYTVLAKPVKEVVTYFNQNSFPNETCGSWALDLAKLLPIIGHFMEVKNWQEIVSKGIVGNISYLAMLTGGAIAMMLSPSGMDTEPESVALTTTLMIGGMTAAMLAEVLLETLTKSAKSLTKWTLWKPASEHQPLLTIEDGNVQDGLESQTPRLT